MENISLFCPNSTIRSFSSIRWFLHWTLRRFHLNAFSRIEMCFDRPFSLQKLTNVTNNQLLVFPMRQSGGFLRISSKCIEITFLAKKTHCGMKTLFGKKNKNTFSWKKQSKNGSNEKRQKMLKLRCWKLPLFFRRTLEFRCTLDESKQRCHWDRKWKQSSPYCYDSSHLADIFILSNCHFSLSFPSNDSRSLLNGTSQSIWENVEIFSPFHETNFMKQTEKNNVYLRRWKIRAREMAENSFYQFHRPLTIEYMMNSYWADPQLKRMLENPNYAIRIVTAKKRHFFCMLHLQRDG